MRCTYDAVIDTAYIYLTEDRSKGAVESFPVVCDNDGPHIVIDMYSDGVMHGFEIVGAARQLGMPFILREANR